MNWVLFFEKYAFFGAFFGALFLLPWFAFNLWKIQGKNSLNIAAWFLKLLIALLFWPLALLLFLGSEVENSDSSVDNTNSGGESGGWRGWVGLASIACFAYIAFSSYFAVSTDELEALRDKRAQAIAVYDALGQESGLALRVEALNDILLIDAKVRNKKYENELARLNSEWAAANSDSKYSTLQEKILHERVRSVPSANYSLNEELYSHLHKIAPGNTEYRNKKEYYSHLKSGSFHIAKSKASKVDSERSECVDGKIDDYLADCKRSCMQDPVLAYCGLVYEARGRSVIGSGCTSFIKNAGPHMDQAAKCEEHACEATYEVIRDFGNACSHLGSLSPRDKALSSVDSFADYERLRDDIRS